MSQRPLEKILESRRDRLAFKRLVDAVRTDKASRPLALVGAGLSARLEYPTWTCLLEGMHRELSEEASEARSASAPSRRRRRAEKQKPPPDAALSSFPDILWRAEEYRRLMGRDRFQEYVAGRFRAVKTTDPCIDAVVQLPFRHILTTNYDPSLDRAHRRLRKGERRTIANWSDRGRIQSFLYRLSDARTERHYVHLHGRFDEPRSLVLCDGDYTQRYIRSQETSKKLFALFAMERFVFLGFSLTDPDLMTILREVAATMAFREPRHFALVGLNADEIGIKSVHRKRLVEKFGVEPIFYSAADGHAELETLLLALLQYGRDAHAPRLRWTSASPRKSKPPAAISQQVTTPGTKSPEAALPPAPVDDPNKYQFGGSPQRNGRRLSATVTRAAGFEDDWFRVVLTVESLPGAEALRGKVMFYLHPTFPDDRDAVPVRNGRAVLTLLSYGAFTVGAKTSDGTRLELDLAELESAPTVFRLR